MGNRRVGKPDPSLLADLLRGTGGKPSDSVLVGPGAGLDAAVLNLEGGSVMAIAEDPIFPAPGLPLDIMSRFTVHIGASDVAVTGVTPQYMTYTLLLPGTASEADARLIMRSVAGTAAELSITIVGGHIGWYDAVTVPIVGGVTVWGIAPADRWISPGGARSGDVILMTKGPAIEAAALLGVLYQERIKDLVDPGLLERLLDRVDQITVVKDALAAFAAGGVHAMHDATEGGVLGGLWEMQAASGIHLHADLDHVPIPAEIECLADLLGFDPWRAISEGTLLAAVDPHAVEKVREVWSEAGIDSFLLGRFDSKLGRNTLRRDGRTTPLPEPGIDPFWNLFFAGLPSG